jgi:DNA-binding response OmpR family regulator
MEFRNPDASRPETISPVRILMLEDSVADAELVMRELRKSGLPFECRRVDTAHAFVRGMSEFQPDLILTDCVLPDVDVKTALKLAWMASPDVPVIVVTGVLLDRLIAKLLDCGAVDYLLKDRLGRLGPAVRRALTESPRARAPLSPGRAMPLSAQAAVA